jgi:hypothetical protein
MKTMLILTKEEIEGMRDHELERLEEALKEGRITLAWYIEIRKDVKRKAEELLKSLNN